MWAPFSKKRWVGTLSGTRTDPSPPSEHTCAATLSVDVNSYHCSLGWNSGTPPDEPPHHHHVAKSHIGWLKSTLSGAVHAVWPMVAACT